MLMSHCSFQKLSDLYMGCTELQIDRPSYFWDRSDVFAMKQNCVLVNLRTCIEPMEI